MQLTHALKWSFFSEIASKAIQPLVFIVLARLLTPEDYGVVAAATMVISFSQIFWEAGMAKAIIQYQGERSAAANTAFWINNLLGILVAAVLVISAEAIADKIFHDLRVASVLQVMSLQILLSASVSVHTALLRKDMQFKHLFWVRLSTVTVPGLLSIPMAWQGMGYWALVIGTLSGKFFQVTLLWYLSSWKPKIMFCSSVAKKLGEFGFWVSLSGILAWFFIWFDSLIVSVFLGAYDLGIYKAGNEIVTIALSTAITPFITVIYSHFTKIKETKLIISNATKSAALINFYSMPVGFGLFLSGNLLEPIFFGNNWKGIGHVISMIGLISAITYTVSINPEIYRSINRPDIETKTMLVSAIVRIPFYFCTISSGLTAFMLGRLFSSIIGCINHQFFLWKTTSISARDYIATFIKPLIYSIFMYIFGLLVSKRICFFEPINQLLIIIPACALFYFILFCIFDFNKIKYFINKTIN